MTTANPNPPFHYDGDDLILDSDDEGTKDKKIKEHRAKKEVAEDVERSKAKVGAQGFSYITY
jgi:hypothetical protein